VSREAPLFIRLYLDEDVHKQVAAGLRLRSFDVVSAHEIGRWGFTDESQLSYASSEGRAIFTYNASDYLELHQEWLRRGKDHCGIIVSDQLRLGETVRRLLRLLNQVAADEMKNQVRWLQAFM
jgi:hypothetical protein